MAIYRQPPDSAFVCLSRHIHFSLQHRVLVTHKLITRQHINSYQWLARYIYLPLAPCSIPATLSIFPYGNPTALSWNYVTSFHSVTRSTAAGGTSRYFHPASAARYATAVSSESTTLKCFCSMLIAKVPQFFCNFALNYQPQTNLL